MKKVTGIIENIEVRSGQGAKGPWTLYLITINGEVYQTFNKALGQKLKVGQKITFHYEDKEINKNGTIYKQKVIHVPSTTERLMGKIDELIKTCKQNQYYLEKLYEDVQKLISPSGETKKETEDAESENQSEEEQLDQMLLNPDEEEIDPSEIPF